MTAIVGSLGQEARAQAEAPDLVACLMAAAGEVQSAAVAAQGQSAIVEVGHAARPIVTVAVKLQQTGLERELKAALSGSEQPQVLPLESWSHAAFAAESDERQPRHAALGERRFVAFSDR